MKDFQSELDARLRALAADPSVYEEPAAEKAPKTRGTRRFRRPAILGSLTAGLGVVAATLAMNGTSFADLPILSTPTTDAAEAARGNTAAAEAGVDFSKAHAFGTPQGPGYVLLTPERDTICISIPDSSNPGGYGSQCKPSIASVERAGLSIEFVGSLDRDPDATSLFAFVLPDGAKDVRIRTSDGRTRAASVEAGVVADEIQDSLTVTWTVDGRPGRRTFAGPFPVTRTAQFSCPDGRIVEADPADLPKGTGPKGLLDPAIIRKACR